MQEEEKESAQDYSQQQQRPDLIARAKEKLLEWRSKKQYTDSN